MKMIGVGCAAFVMMTAAAMVTGAAAADDCPATGVFYSVEHALCEENIGNVTLDAAGRFLAIRRLEPARRAKTFPWSMDAHFLSLHRSSLSILDLGAGTAATPRTVVRYDQAYSYAMSPDGARLLFLKAEGDTPTIRVRHLASGKEIVLDGAPDAYGVRPTWISNTEVVYADAPSRLTPSRFGETMAEEWRAAEVGERSTASAVGSGRYARDPARAAVGGLTVADVVTGRQRRVSPGRFLAVSPSPDGRWLATLRLSSPPLKVDAPLEQFFHVRYQLVVLPSGADGTRTGATSPVTMSPTATSPTTASADTTSAATPRPEAATHGPCGDCQMLTMAVAWSPDGRELAFAARPWSAPSDPPGIWRWRLGDPAARRVDLGGLELVADGFRLERSELATWVGTSLLVRVIDRRKAASPPTSMTPSLSTPAASGAATTTDRATTATPASDRPSWFLLRDDGSVVDVAKTTGTTSAAPVRVAGDALLVAADGDVWLVSSADVARNLTADVPEPLVASSALANPSTRDLVLVERVQKEKGKGAAIDTATATTNVFLLNPDTQAVTRFGEIPAGANVLDLDTASRTLVYRRQDGRASSVWVAAKGGAPRLVSRANAHLNGVKSGRVVSIAHKSPAGAPLHSRLLLPPGYDKERPLPTVVIVYPGAEFEATAAADEGLFSKEGRLLTTRGYAVLLPSIPVDEKKLPRSPLDGLADSVLAAVDAAAAEGYVDATRLAIEGHSFGGFAVGAILGQTDRFRAGVAIAGPFNLLSGYGLPRIGNRLRTDLEPQDLSMGVGWAETGQGGLGGPPWRDPERYAKNSPLMHVERIRTPLLLIHGDMDSTVRFSQSEEMFTALLRLNKDAQFVRYWGEGHGLPYSPANVRDYWARLFAWYGEHLGPGFDVAHGEHTGHAGQ